MGKCLKKYEQVCVLFCFKGEFRRQCCLVSLLEESWKVSKWVSAGFRLLEGPVL